MVEFASRWPDMRLWAINRAKTGAGSVKVSAERDEDLAQQIVIGSSPAQLETAVSRQFIISVEAWGTSKDNGLALCQEAMYRIGSSPRRGAFIRLVTQSGPQERRDESGNYFYSGTVTVVGGAV